MPTDTVNLTIALDARAMHSARRRGTGKNLVDLYRRVLELRPHWRVIGYHRGGANPLADVPGYQPRGIEMVGDRFDAWQRWRLPMAAWRDGAHVLHCPANTCPSVLPMPTLLTVHDLLPLEAGGMAASRFRRSVRTAVRRGLSIITPSQFTAEELTQRFGASPEQVVVNAWAADGAMHHVTDGSALSALRERYGLGEGPVVLHMGASDARKNTRRVVEAFAELPEAIRRRWTLLVIGIECAAQRAELERLAGACGAAGAIRVRGFADEADMPALLSVSQVLAYPSLGEGFGLPVLDAFAARCAVLTSRCSSLPEVAGDAAYYVQPGSLASVSEGLARMLSDAALRAELVERGAARLGHFTWQRTAARFAGAVERTVQRRAVGRACFREGMAEAKHAAA